MIRTPASRRCAWWCCRANPHARWFTFAGNEEADSDAALCGLRDPPDHPAVGHVRVDHVERRRRAFEQPRELGGDRPEASGRVVEHAGGQGLPTHLERREQVFKGSRTNLPAEPPDARKEHELELRDDRPGDAHEQVVKAAVPEVILDAGAAYPSDATVDDRELAVVDVPERAEVPPVHASAAQAPVLRTHLHRAHHPDLHAARHQSLVVGARAALRIRAPPVDDDPHRDALRRLGDQRIGEGVPDESRPEAELADVHRVRGRPDVVEHPRVEGLACDENLRR